MPTNLETMTMWYDHPRAPNPYDFVPSAPAFEVTSADFEDGGTLARPHMRDIVGGEDRSPQLAWHGFPAQTRSFAVTCLDPDAPVPTVFWHWWVANIPAAVTALPAGAGSPGHFPVASAVHVRNDAGRTGFVGVKPPVGDVPHRYVFAVAALDVEQLQIEEGSSPALASFRMASHIVGRALITATYEITATVRG